MKKTLGLFAALCLSAFALPASAHHQDSGAPTGYLVSWKGNRVIAGKRDLNRSIQEPWKMGFVSKFRLVGEGLSITLP